MGVPRQGFNNRIGDYSHHNGVIIKIHVQYSHHAGPYGHKVMAILIPRCCI
jgi:hypothetical protein